MKISRARRQPDPPSGVSRRGLLLGGTAALAGAAVAGAGAAGPARAEESQGQQIVPCWGAHQAGVDTPPQAFAAFVGLDLRKSVGRADLTRLMRLWTSDIERMTQGQPALADGSQELATVPARLSVAVGFGPGVFRTTGLESQQPSWLRQLPAFSVDRLRKQWSEGDVLLQIGADDPIAVSHAMRVLLTDAEAFATVKWIQKGFHRAVGMEPGQTTGRNLMGQIDGTINPQPGTDDFDQVVWIRDDPAWLAGGTGVVIRRIQMGLDNWAAVDRPAREQVIGRRLSDGAPLSGSQESDPVDLEAVDENGLKVIPAFAHARVAHAQQPHERILRRPFNYDEGLVDGTPDAGQVFVAYAADIERQFIPIQRRLAGGDALNAWTTPIGSAVFAILPGFEQGGWIGQSLLE